MKDLLEKSIIYIKNKIKIIISKRNIKQKLLEKYITNKIYFNSGIQVKNACVFVIGSSRNVTEAGSVGG